MNSAKVKNIQWLSNAKEQIFFLHKIALHSIFATSTHRKTQHLLVPSSKSAKVSSSNTTNQEGKIKNILF